MNPYPGWTGAGSKLYLFGGYSTEEDYLGQGLWAISTASSTWAHLSFGNEEWSAPETRANMCFGSSWGVIYVLWGALGREVDDLWVYNSASDSWSAVPGHDEGKYPVPRERGSLLDVEGQLLLVHGTGAGTTTLLPLPPVCDFN